MRQPVLLAAGALLAAVGLAALAPCPGPAGGDGPCIVGDSLFQRKYNYPTVWWVVYPADVPKVANTALTLRSALTSSYEDFAEQVLLAVARNQTQDIAKSIGYMINANATLGGGCPVPPPPAAFLGRVGNGFAACLEYAANQTGLFGAKTEAQLGVPAGGLARVTPAAVTDALLAAMFVAGRSCGPPDALSSSTLQAIQDKYVNSTCYYAGPILRDVTDNNTLPLPCYNATFEADMALANQTDPYVAGPLLAAYKQCVVGPPSVLQAPSWINFSFGPVVSIDSGGGGAASTGTSSGGRTGTGSISLLDGDVETATMAGGSSTAGRR